VHPRGTSSSSIFRAVCGRLGFARCPGRKFQMEVLAAISLYKLMAAWNDMLCMSIECHKSVNLGFLPPKLPPEGVWGLMPSRIGDSFGGSLPV
jgi:hypothetical protein